MASFRHLTLILVLSASVSSKYSLSQSMQRDSNVTTQGRNETRDHELFLRKDGDPTDYSWVKSLAAIGDSFTAGVGAGNHLGDVYHNQNSWICSRYDLSYPMLVKSIIGPSVREFQFPACSGDRSIQIFEQVKNLKGNIDMLIMTAGGNDLCLVCCAPRLRTLPPWSVLILFVGWNDQEMRYVTLRGRKHL